MMLNVIVSPFFIAFIACSGYVNEAEEAKEEATWSDSFFIFYFFFFWSKREFKTTLIKIGKVLGELELFWIICDSCIVRRIN